MKIAPLSNAIRAALGASLLVSVAMPAFAQDANDVEVEEVVITGSKIKRTTNT